MPPDFGRERQDPYLALSHLWRGGASSAPGLPSLKSYISPPRGEVTR
jgi:hypothetical protein